MAYNIRAKNLFCGNRNFSEVWEVALFEIFKSSYFQIKGGFCSLPHECSQNYFLLYTWYFNLTIAESCMNWAFKSKLLLTTCLRLIFWLKGTEWLHFYFKRDLSHGFLRLTFVYFLWLIYDLFISYLLELSPWAGSKLWNH